jgi:hypothetical protein
VIVFQNSVAALAQDHLIADGENSGVGGEWLVMDEKAFLLVAFCLLQPMATMYVVTYLHTCTYHLHFNCFEAHCITARPTTTKLSFFYTVFIYEAEQNRRSFRVREGTTQHRRGRRESHSFSSCYFHGLFLSPQMPEGPARFIMWRCMLCSR